MRIRRPYSLESLIVLSAALVFIVVGSLLVLTIRSNATTAADEAFDRVLEAAALSIADTVGYVDGEVTVDIPYSAFAILGTSRLNRIFYRVAAPDGGIVTGDPVLGLEMTSARGPDIRFQDSVMQNEPIRLAAVSRYRSDATTGEAGWIDVFVGETREARDQLTAQLTADALLPAVAIALCAFGIIWVGIRLAFAPLRSIEHQLTRRTPSNLDPINEHLPREIATLARALNGFMGRLFAALEGLRRVTADAAHQFRTPLAAMRLQAELALEENDPALIRRRLERIHANAVTTSTLATRLLADATLLHSITAGETEPVDLVALTKTVVNQAVIDSGADWDQGPVFHAPQTALWINADPASLAEAIRNVIDNAFLYAGGPTSVTLKASANTVVLEICDRGPGIPADRRERVFERFERDTDHPGGTGLGLAITRDVISALGGTVSLMSPATGGLCVVISIPSASRPNRSSLETRRHYCLALLVATAVLTASPWTTEPVQAQVDLTLTAPLADQRVQPLLDAVRSQFGGINLTYQQARSAQVVARLSAGVPFPPNLVIMPAPDIAVAITNQGHVAPMRIEPAGMPSGGQSSWRSELFALAFDPAVILVSSQWAQTNALPTSRLELVQALETREDLLRRIGIVNVGIDAVSYTLATQDSLRSPLYWRLAAAFGSAQARIYDTGTELVAALRRGEIDLAYNVPLSEAVATGASDFYEIVMPQDYVLALPWTLFAPERAWSVHAEQIANFLLSERGLSLVSRVLWGTQRAPALDADYQRIAMGPELLVYLDSIKRSNFLDAWFELVTSP